MPMPRKPGTRSVKKPHETAFVTELLKQEQAPGFVRRSFADPASIKKGAGK